MSASVQISSSDYGEEKCSTNNFVAFGHSNVNLVQLIKSIAKLYVAIR
jgi:hypothetical protein